MPSKYQKSSIDVDTPIKVLSSPYNNASDERHVKFDLADDFDLKSEMDESVMTKNTKADDVTITMQPE